MDTFFSDNCRLKDCRPAILYIRKATISSLFNCTKFNLEFDSHHVVQ